MKVYPGFAASLFFGLCFIQGDSFGQENMEDAAARARLPEYKTIPAASELTAAIADKARAGDNWTRSNADAANTRYSSLDQINQKTVSKLQVAWVYRSGDGKGNVQANPVIAEGMIFAPTAGKNIVAINAETGREIWRFHPSGDEFSGTAQRGLIYWAGDSRQRARLFFTAGGYLYALDPQTGRPVASFGAHGRVPSSGVVAPAVYKNIIVVPNGDVVAAFDVVTGAPLWRFDILQYPVPDRKADNGGNCWGGMAMDRARGIAFIATGDPHPNFVGIDRPGSNKHTNSILALDARTGRLLWSFQDIAHDIWDLDIASPPNLVSITHNGKLVDAVAQVTKQGNTLLLDRLTGKPLFPYRLRRAPVSKLAGERTAPYQPDLQMPEPFARQVFTLNDITDLSPAAHKSVLKQVKGANFGWFKPLELNKPTVFYGIHGGAEWPGAAFDPTTGWLYISANEIPWHITLTPVEEPNRGQASQNASIGAKLYQENCAVCHGVERSGKGMAPPLLNLNQRLSEAQVETILKNGRGAMPPFSFAEGKRKFLLRFLFGQDAEKRKADSPSGNYVDTPGRRISFQGYQKLEDDQGYPGTRPPWGTLTAINLNSGKIAWKIPLGEYEELTRRGIPKTGTENFGGAMVTAGNLVFAAGTRDRKIRAFDKITGGELWQYTLPYGGFAAPATYEVKGRQYIVIAASGGGKLRGVLGDAYVAFALPK